MSEKGFVQYIAIIAVILAVVFLSQQPYFRGIGRDMFSKGSSAVQGYLAKGSNWAKDIALPKISGEVAQKQAMVANGIDQQKEKVSESVGTKIKNYVSGVVDSVLGKSNSNFSAQNCPPVQCPSCPSKPY